MSFRPVSLKLGGYPPNEKPLRGLPRLHRLHDNKENLYAIVRRHPPRLLRRRDSDSDIPTTSTQIGAMKPVNFERNLRERELFSTSSSLSDDELELSRKKGRERFSTHYSTSDLTTSDSSIGPSWISSNRRFIRIPSFRHNFINSTTSLEQSDNLKEFELENEDDNDLVSSEDDLDDESRENKNADMRRLDSIEEMSPVLPAPNHNDDQEDLPPQITPLRFATSTALSGARFPTTNPRHKQPNTPLRRMGFEQPRSLFELRPTRSEEFGLPSQMSKYYGVKGILFMTISFRSKTRLNVFVQHGTFFLERYPELSTYVVVEIKSNKRPQKRTKTTDLPSYRSNIIKRTHQPDFNHDVTFTLNKENYLARDKLGISVYAVSDTDRRDELLGSMTFPLRRLKNKAKHNLETHHRSEDSRIKVCDGGYFLLGDNYGPFTNMPQEKVYHRKYYDEIGSNAFQPSLTFESSHKMMGEADWRTALTQKDPKLDPRRHSVQVNSSHRMPLNGRPTTSNQHYYPSTQEYFLGAQESSKHEHRRYGPLSALISASPRKKASLPVRTISTDQQHVSSESSSLMSKGGISSSNSSSSSSAGYKSHHRYTLPSIITTDSSDCANGSSNRAASDHSKRHVNQQLLYADVPPSSQQMSMKPVKTRSGTQKGLPSANSHRFITNQPSISTVDDNAVTNHSTVRRVASFTYSTDDKHNKQTGRKFTFAPISKIGSILRNKVDSAYSTSILSPAREDVRLWQHSFDALLQNKYGRLMFREFVTKEISSENLDFYEDVEGFKKLKPGKKSTIQKAEYIYNTYLKEGSPKELNLESQVKQATLKAYEAGCLPDTFNLAQSRIEQLMAKDSYSRFIHSKPYLDLLNSTTPTLESAPKQQAKSTELINSD